MNIKINMNHDGIMFMLIVSLFAGIASTMNVLIDNLDDFNIGLNDIYMTGIMTGWMFFFMGLFTLHTYKALFGIILVLIFFVAIRKQLFISERQYMRSMIPHHSAAIMMSKRLQLREQEKSSFNLSDLAKQIIKTQRDEINYMKYMLYNKS